MGAQQPALSARSGTERQVGFRADRPICLSITLIDLQPQDAKGLLISPTNVSNDYHQRCL
jgi:hypothetical protein